MRHCCKKNWFKADCFSHNIKSATQLLTHTLPTVLVDREHLSWSFSINSKADLRYSGHRPWNHLLLLLSHFTSELSVNVPGSEYKVLPLLLPTMLLTQAITICILEYWNTYNSSLCLWFCSAFRLYPIKYKSYYITLINSPVASLPGTNGPK